MGIIAYVMSLQGVSPSYSTIEILTDFGICSEYKSTESSQIIFFLLFFQYKDKRGEGE